MQDIIKFIIDEKDDVVHFSCAFCSKERKLKKKTFEKKALCASCAIRTLGYDTLEDSFGFLKAEYEDASEKLSKHGLTLLETKQTFTSAKKCVCLCECGKKHRVLLSSFEKESYRPCPLKRTRTGLNSTKEDKIRELFKERGCEYIGPYINNKTLTKYICSCGQESEVRVHAMKENWKGCRECSYKSRAEALRK
ncbi:conserved hypothetical protein [Lausannevirus]|uniref:Uncharacterized protein n=1 Tax=Lausannevirus TaxID=999883 RepID=F2WLT2_9VIRU|nr:hypothetical protein LAU_0354 [Lausannevirus]AEA07205.1 conserved hypothetical protein [Lausannevirus]